MRFTSPDPAASPFYNLYHYGGNSPARYFDPDGLQLRQSERSAAEIVEELERAQRENGGRNPSRADLQRARDGASTADVVHETFKEVNHKATVGIAEGADESTETGRRVKEAARALDPAIFAGEMVMGGPIIGGGGKLLRGAAELRGGLRIFRAGDDVLIAGGRSTSNTIFRYADDAGGVIAKHTDDAGRVFLQSRMDKIGRVTSVTMRVAPETLGTGTRMSRSATAAVRQFAHAGDDVGHLAGKLLGGPGTRDNAIAQIARINRGQYRVFEQYTIKPQAHAGNTVFVRIRPDYIGNSMRPRQVFYQYRVNGVTVKPNPFPN